MDRHGSYTKYSIVLLVLSAGVEVDSRLSFAGSVTGRVDGASVRDRLENHVGRQEQPAPFSPFCQQKERKQSGSNIWRCVIVVAATISEVLYIPNRTQQEHRITVIGPILHIAYCVPQNNKLEDNLKVRPFPPGRATVVAFI